MTAPTSTLLFYSRTFVNFKTNNRSYFLKLWITLWICGKLLAYVSHETLSIKKSNKSWLKTQTHCFTWNKLISLDQRRHKTVLHETLNWHLWIFTKPPEKVFHMKQSSGPNNRKNIYNRTRSSLLFSEIQKLSLH